ncbi:DUF1565 domain-containing protein [Paenibacillus hubeiensis]|uniref:DUF1565 domain-containing protein n=1 Tax=Paenibacillus hubeiensis TaxID=3077330 RepID=UPI003F654724
MEWIQCLLLLLGMAADMGTESGNKPAASAGSADSTYYVSKEGSDANPGTSSKPWKTLQRAADTVPAGGTVHVRGGVYNEKLKMTRSGSASKGPIAFVSDGSDKAIIDGSGLSVTGSEGLVELSDVEYVTIQGFEIRNYSTASRDVVPMGIYVHGSGSFIQLVNNDIHDIHNTASPAGDDLHGRDAHGIAVYGTKAPESIRDITIANNELHHLVLGSSESLVLNGNVDHFVVSGNRIHDNDNIGIDLIGFEGIAPDAEYDQVRNGVVKENYVYNISANNNPSYGKELPNGSFSAGGIYVDGGKESVIERNYSYDNDIGIEIASEHAGRTTDHITVRSNLVYNNRLAGIAIGGYDDERGSTSHAKIVNNTLYNNDTLEEGSGQLFVQYDTRNNVIQNNIFVASASGVLISNDYTENAGNVVDHNLYFAKGGPEDAEWTWMTKGYNGFAAYQAGSGNDAHSRFMDPQFMHAGKGDFRLRAASPAMDTGKALGDMLGTFDLDGNPRVSGSGVNMGAYE